MSKIQQIKQKYGLDTDRAGDLKSSVYNWAIVAVILDKFADHILGMTAGWVQTLLMILFMAALSYISRLTVGDKPRRDEQDDDYEPLGDSSPLNDVLREARKP